MEKILCYCHATFIILLLKGAYTKMFTSGLLLHINYPVACYYRDLENMYLNNQPSIEMGRATFSFNSYLVGVRKKGNFPLAATNQ